MRLNKKNEIVTMENKKQENFKTPTLEIINLHHDIVITCSPECQIDCNHVYPCPEDVF